MHLRMHKWIRKAVQLGLAFAIAAPSVASAVSKEEVVTLTKLGISDAEVIKAIDKDRSVFSLEIQDILALKQAGVSEEVIKHMLKTPQLYGAKEPTSQGTGTVAVTPSEKTPEEIAAEQERLRLEAQRLAEEGRKVRDAQRKLYAQSILKRGQELADGGEFVEAIKQFQGFVQQGNHAPGSEEYYIAQYGIANALLKAGLLQSAAKTLVEVILEGPDRPFFQPALRDLREVRRTISYSPPDLEELTKFYVGGFSQAFQDEFNYILGEFFYDFNNYTNALRYFEQVSPDSTDFGKAAYLKGLIQVRNQLYRSAVESFQNAILATERNQSDPEVADLSYLALARIAYESGDYDAAIYYYRKMPQDSTKLPIAYYESAWTYFVNGDFMRALGTFQSLHSPYFEHYFYPELWILEATVYLNMCRYDLTEKAIEMFNERVASLMMPLEEFLRNVRTPSDFYTAVAETVNGTKTHLPRVLVNPVLSNAEFYNLYRTVRQIERERKLLAPRLAELGPFGQELSTKLQASEQSKVNELGIKIQQLMKKTQADIQNYAIKVTEIQVDLDAEKLRQIDTDIRKLAGEEVDESAPAAAGSAGLAIVGADSLQWPFEAEYWKDEIQGYRAFVQERCTK